MGYQGQDYRVPGRAARPSVAGERCGTRCWIHPGRSWLLVCCKDHRGYTSSCLSSVESSFLHPWLCQVSDMLANHMVCRWQVLVASVEPHPHGQHQQGPGSARPDHPCPVLPTWCSCWVVADLPRHKVLQVPCLAGRLAQDEEAVGAPHAVRRLHPRESSSQPGLASIFCLVTGVLVCCLHVPHVPRTGVWRTCRSLCAC